MATRPENIDRYPGDWRLQTDKVTPNEVFPGKRRTLAEMPVHLHVQDRRSPA